MRISDWSSDVCSSDLREVRPVTRLGGEREAADLGVVGFAEIIPQALPGFQRVDRHGAVAGLIRIGQPDQPVLVVGGAAWVRQRSLLEQHGRSEEHTSELQSLMRISYAVFCLKKK